MFASYFMTSLISHKQRKSDQNKSNVEHKSTQQILHDHI